MKIFNKISLYKIALICIILIIPVVVIIYAEKIEVKSANIQKKKSVEAKILNKSKKSAVKNSQRKTFTNRFGMKFVYIEPGTFVMGSQASEKGRESDEKAHTVTLTKGYYLQTTEVTQTQWRAVMGSNPSFFSRCGENCPVEKVSWDDVQEFIKRLNQRERVNTYRLPTEAEWEYACRAGSASAFANGDISKIGCEYDPVLDEIGWYCGNSDKGPRPVAKKQANFWGLYDMHGNVWEWCQDNAPYDSSDGVRTPTYIDGIIDPVSSFGSWARVNRGGSWIDYAVRCRSAFRNVHNHEQRLYNVGFRLCKSP